MPPKALWTDRAGHPPFLRLIQYEQIPSPRTSPSDRDNVFWNSRIALCKSVRRRSRMPPFAFRRPTRERPFWFASRICAGISSGSGRSTSSAAPRSITASSSSRSRSSSPASRRTWISASGRRASRSRCRCCRRGSTASDVILEQRDLVERLHRPRGRRARGSSGTTRRWRWRSRAISNATSCVYDNMDELSLFRGASRELARPRERAVRPGRPRLHGRHEPLRGQAQPPSQRPRLPVLDRLRPFRQGAQLPGSDPPDQAGIPRPRLGFFGVIDERMDVDLVGQVAELRPDWQFVMIGPVVKIDPAILPRRANIHWLGRQGLQRAAALSRRLGRRLHAVRPQRGDEVHLARPRRPSSWPPACRWSRRRSPTWCGPTARRASSRSPGRRTRSSRKAESAARTAEGAPGCSKVDRHLAAGSWDKTWAAMHKLMLRRPRRTASDRPAASLPTYATTPAE